MYTAIIILHVIVSIFLVVTVLLQVGKGASIGSTFGGTSSQALFGSAGPATFLTKITIACAVVFMFTSLYLTYLSGRTDTGSLMKEVPAVKETPAAQPDSEKGAPAGAAQEEGSALKAPSGDTAEKAHPKTTVKEGAKKAAPQPSE